MLKQILETQKLPTRMHVYGLSGSGKSYYVDKLTNGQKRAIIDIDAGFLYLAQKGDYYSDGKANGAFSVGEIEKDVVAAVKSSATCIILDGISTYMALLQKEGTEVAVRRLRAKNKNVDWHDTDARFEPTMWAIWKSAVESLCNTLASSGKDVYIIQRAKLEVDKEGDKTTKRVVVEGFDIPIFAMDTSVYCEKKGNEYMQTVEKNRKVDRDFSAPVREAFIARLAAISSSIDPVASEAVFTSGKGFNGLLEPSAVSAALARMQTIPDTELLKKIGK